ncbi:CASP-like protein 4A3 [Neltuma alba]|uniref:CASP-like protein 4A3 n=1 Tax=Neltuma alba TaxID=207710 RepID=UPI0010A3C4AE|nr:CASP-like protein 4A3 [Prosopis alba]
MSEGSEEGMKSVEPKVKAAEAGQKDLVAKDADDSVQKKKDPTLSDAPPFLTHQSSSLRSRKSPSPPVQSSSESPISEGHCSPTPTLDKRFSPPPQNSPPHSSPDSSISSDLCSIADGAPPVEDHRFSPRPQEKPASPVVVANRFQVEPKVVTKVDPGAQKGVVGVNDVEEGTGAAGSGSDNRRLRPDVYSLLRSKKESKLNKALLGLRIVASVLCLASFSVLAADRDKGWALDSFYVYKELRYNFSVNVIGFVYSGLQVIGLVNYFITGKYLSQHRLRGFFNFSMDQILTYLLMSASSTAATRAYDWESNWGEDVFPEMANASAGLSFVAFVAFALTSLVSGYVLCKFR